MSGEHGAAMEKTYWKVFGVLLVFTTATYFLAENIENKVAATIAGLSIALVKSSFVIFFFMHLKWESKWKYVLLVPTCMAAAVLVLALLPDIGGFGSWETFF